MALTKLFDLVRFDESGNSQTRCVKTPHSGFVDSAHLGQCRSRRMNGLKRVVFELTLALHVHISIQELFCISRLTCGPVPASFVEWRHKAHHRGYAPSWPLGKTTLF